jgi:hypothetical protein
MRLRTGLSRLTKSLGPGPRSAAAEVEEAYGLVLKLLRGRGGFEPAPPGLSAAALPRCCKVYLFDPEMCLLGCVDPQTGAAAVTAVRGIDLDIVLGKKPGLLCDAVPRDGAIGSRPSQPKGDVR